MGLFEKRYDLKKDCLRLVFDIEKKGYDFYYGNVLIDYSKLNRYTKKYLDNENNKLKNNVDLLNLEIEKDMIVRRFNKLKSLGYSCDSFEYLGVVNGSMSKQMEDLLNKLVCEDDVLIGIHRIGIDDSSKKISDILKNGLEITGHLGGSAKSNKELKNNVGYYPNNKTIIKELMYADNYKNSKGSILIRIPDVDLDKNIFVVDENNKTRLNPKYIVGYVPVFDNHHLETIITLDMIDKNNDFSYKFIEKEDNSYNYQVDNQYENRRGR